MSTHPDFDERARRVIDENAFMVLGTIEPDGRPRLSPVYYTPAGYRDFYWVSEPASHHSRNIAARPAVSLVIFDSSVAPRDTQAAYLSGTARMLRDDELDAVIAVAFREVRGARAMSADELRGDDAELKLYVAVAETCEIHVRGGDPVHGSGIDRREAAAPWRPTNRRA